MKQYRDLEDLLFNTRSQDLLDQISDILWNNACEKQESFESLLKDMDDNQLMEHIYSVMIDSRMRQIHVESLQDYFNDELKIKGIIHPEAHRLLEWFEENA